MFCRSALPVADWWMAPDEWALDVPGNQSRLDTWEVELVSAVRPSTPLSKASPRSLDLVSW